MKASRVGGDEDGGEDVKDTPEGHAPTIPVGQFVEAPLPLCRCETKAVHAQRRFFVILYDLVGKRDPASRCGVAT